MAEIKRKKRRRRRRRRSPLRWIIPLILILALIGGGLWYANRSYMIVGGELIPRDSAVLDLREYHLSEGEYRSIADQYPDREYRWSVPLSSGRVDSASESLTLSSLTAEDLGLLSYFPSINAIDVRSADITPDFYDTLVQALPNVSVRWSVPIGGVRYDSESRTLELSSDIPEEDFSLLRYFPALETVDGRALENVENLAALQKSREDLSVLWQVTVDGTVYDQSAREIALSGEGLTADALRETLGKLPELELVRVSDCPFTMEEQTSLMSAFPSLTFAWEIPLFGARYTTAEENVSLAGRKDLGEKDLQELLAVAPMLTGWQTLDLTDTSFTQEQKMAIADALPDTQVLWSFDWCGVPVTTADEKVDLNEIPMENTDEVEKMLPYMYNLNWVEMCDCGIPYKDMNELNKRYEDVRFVWMIRFSKYSFRTDTRGFRGTSNHYGIITEEDAWYFTYCEDLICLDIGHRAPNDLSFLREMPQLVYLMINGNFNLKDISPVGTLKNLRWLEMFMDYAVTDISPLIGCTSLSDLNIIVAGVTDQEHVFQVISQMPWLDRLWFSNRQLTQEQEDKLKELNPKLQTWRGFGKNDSTSGPWRADLDYYEMRDILFPGDKRWYMGPFGGKIPFRVIDGVRYDDVDGEWVALGNDPNEGVNWYAHMAD
ncbi:MAG: hypothetical protein IKO22_03305 [Oscillospiraceae bacterium]|nr:hypothetical protein [Oscillospiraceae bacterium]